MTGTEEKMSTAQWDREPRAVCLTPRTSDVCWWWEPEHTGEMSHHHLDPPPHTGRGCLSVCIRTGPSLCWRNSAPTVKNKLSVHQHKQGYFTPLLRKPQKNPNLFTTISRVWDILMLSSHSIVCLWNIWLLKGCHQSKVDFNHAVSKGKEGLGLKWNLAKMSDI